MITLFRAVDFISENDVIKTTWDTNFVLYGNMIHRQYILPIHWRIFHLS